MVRGEMPFHVLAETFEKLEATSSRNQMIDILASLFRKSSKSEVKKLVYLCQGLLAPSFEGIDFGLGEKLVEDAIVMATGRPDAEVGRDYRTSGDLGTTAENLLSKPKKQARLVQAKALTVAGVYDTLMELAVVSGKGSQDKKLKLLEELLTNASPKEARYIARIPLGKLRLGIGDPSILDAFSISVAKDKSLRGELERAYNLCSDLGLVAETFYSEGIEGIRRFRIRVGSPVRPALAERLPNPEDVLKKIGKCAVEAKYDGLRLQVHKDGARVDIYSRNLEKMTHMFPDIVSAVKRQVGAKKAVFEGEALAFNENTGEFYPFQATIQRKRKYGVEEMAREFPLRLFAFDVLLVDGEDCTLLPYGERRKILSRLIGKGDVIALSDQIITGDTREFEKYFGEAVERGLEGVVAKDLSAPYTAGARKFAWIKLKRSYKGELADTIDVVIGGYFRGRGLRAEFGLGGLLALVYDKKKDTFRTIAKIGSGFTEENMKRLKQLLDDIKVGHRPARVDSLIEPAVWVEPKYVITVRADEITRSQMHTCCVDAKGGYALRFPRMVGWIREDKKPEDATTVDEIVGMFDQQKRVSSG